MIAVQPYTKQPEISCGDRHANLMGDNIIGTYLSKEILDFSNPSETTRDELRRFIDDQEDIQDPRLLGSGVHGVVVLAIIKGVDYALKVFKKWKQPGPVYYRYEDAIYTSPLANESRAFARLDSHSQNGTWAARCHGWMKLSDTQFKVIRDVVDTSGLSSHDLSHWVLVKEYLPMLTNTSHFKEMRENLKIPQALRIFPQDLRLENYRGSKFVDLSSTLTAQCPGWSDFEFEFFNSQIAPRMFKEDN